MNTVVTSRQALLAASRTVARRQGLGGLSIRAVAAEARVSVGSVYNYFSGKTELLAATVEEIWMQILSAPEGFIAVFYTGLGASLLTAGLRFLLAVSRG